MLIFWCHVVGGGGKWASSNTKKCQTFSGFSSSWDDSGVTHKSQMNVSGFGLLEQNKIGIGRHEAGNSLKRFQIMWIDENSYSRTTFGISDGGAPSLKRCFTLNITCRCSHWGCVLLSEHTRINYPLLHILTHCVTHHLNVNIFRYGCETLQTDF